MISSRSAPNASRAITLRTFVSTVATGAPNAIEATAAAVYGPTPGSARSAAGSPGTEPSWSRTIARAVSCSATARRWYPRPAHAVSTSPRGAAASASTVGNRSRNATKIGPTRDACVCCSITSETSVA